MGFYSGRPGKSFEIARLFDSVENMHKNVATDNVQIGDFVIISNEKSADNGKIFIKKFDGNIYSYSQIGNIGGVMPHITKDGFWSFDTNNAYAGEKKFRAVAKEIKLEIETDRQVNPLSFLYRDTDMVDTEGNIIETAPLYGLSDLTQKYVYTKEAGWQLSPEGEYVVIYRATENGEFIYENLERATYSEKDGYCFLDTDIWQIHHTTQPVFKTDWLKWKYIGEEEWHDLFEITGLVNIEFYAQQASMAMSSAEESYRKTEKLANEVELVKIDYDKISTKLNENIEYAEGYANEAKSAAEDVRLALEDFREENRNPELSSLSTEIEQSRASFGFLNQRLELMPYQFDTITEMQKATQLSIGDRVFTFGRDTIGDGDSSKLFEIFDPNDKRLEEIIEGSVTEENPEGEKKIAEQYPVNGGQQIAGLLTIFSGYGSGGGGGAGVPSISVTGSDKGFSVKEGETITLEYFWTGPTAGKATLFVKDSKDSKVVDYYDNNKVYSNGVTINGFGAGSITLQPSKGEHNYTFYVIDRAQAYSNEVKVKVVAGSMSLSVDLPDGKTFSATSAINYNFTVNTIYSKYSVLNYTITQNGQLYDAGEIVSSNAIIGAQSIRLPIKTSTQSIGQGQFKITVYAYVQDDPSIVTNTITRNFIIMEENVIYLTTSFDGDTTPGYQGDPISIPLQLIYVGGSDFVIEGRYSTSPDFAWEDGIPTTPPSTTKDREGSLTYSVTFQDMGTYYIKFKASSNAVTAVGFSEIIKVNIEEKISKYPLQREDALMIHYNAKKGQTNGANKYTWENISKQQAGLHATLTGFNYSSNGWETKNINGVETPTGYLHCSGKSYVSIPYQFYNTITPTQGGTFEIVFKAADVASDQVIYSMTLADGFGFYIYKEKAVFNIPELGAANMTAYYNIKGVGEEDEPCHIALTLDPVNRYAKIYCNGVLSRAIADFNYNSILSVLNTTSYINRSESNSNPQYGIVKVDCVRFYNTCLTDTEIIRNYIYNLRDEKKQAELWVKNYLDSDSDNQFPTEIPYMTFYLNKNDWIMMDKDNHKPKIRVKYHDPNPAEGNEMDYTWDNTRTSWQGTSSIAYPVKNFKIKLPEKYKLKGSKYSLNEKTFCLKADYMDSSHCHNTGTANFIHSTGLLSNYNLTPAQSKELNISVADGYKGLNNLPSTNLNGDELIKPKPIELKTRTCIDGHPIALYVCLETDESAADENRTADEREYESPLYWGIYNFNLDKGSNDSFGLTREDDDFQNVTSFEIAANSSYSAGGFRALRFVKKIGTEEYGWTRWNVGFTPIESSGNYKVELDTGAFLNITKAQANGEILYEIRNIEFDYRLNGQDKHFIGVYNATLNDIYGVTVESDRYSEDGSPSAEGKYIALYKYNEDQNTLYLDEDGVPVVLGYYDYTVAGWSYDVPIASEIYDLKTSWELYGEYGKATEENLPKNAIKLSFIDENNEFSYVVLKEPENIDAKYDYYESDFELRYPDADVYLTYQDKPNKLYWKEYDKIIALAEWVDYVGIDKEAHFTNEFKSHFNQDTLINYYLTLMTTGLIDNFGKNLMINTWGYDKNGEIPYDLFEDENGNIYHKVWKFISQWDEDEEYYLDDGIYQYGLMDINNPIETESGIKYNVYTTDEKYSTLGELIEKADFGGTTDDRITGWYHEIDISQILWYTHFYDLDSSLGVNNTGILSFGPSIEMNDDFYINIDNQKVPYAPFNTSNSALWQQVVINLHPAIKSRFLELSKLGSIYTIDNFKKYYYQDIIDAMGIRMYNADSFPKYLSREPIKCIINGAVTQVYPDSFDHLALGNDWQRISKWLERRIKYLTSMFEADQEKKGSFSFRLEDPNTPYTLQIECYEPYYMNVSYKNGSHEVVRVAGFNETIVKSTKAASGAGDQEIFISPPDNIKSVKEITSPKQLGFSTVFLNGATRLLSIDLSNSQRLTEISLNTNQILFTKSINVSNCPNLGGNLFGHQFPYLEYINTTGSNISFSFNPSGGQIETAILEANGLSLNIVDHSDLKNLTIQLTYNKLPTEQNVNVEHNGKYSVISFDNCSDPNFSFNVKGRYLDENNNWAEVPTQIFDKFISNYGVFSLFSQVQNLTIRNSLKDSLEIEQLQPNGELLIVKEFVLSLPRLKKLELIKTNFDKIALVSSSIVYDGQTIYAGYPGWGGNPEVVSSNGIYTFTGDSNYIAEKAEGIIGDSSIKELEFRGPYLSDKLPSNSLPTAGKFEFPWRIYLGTMPKLQRLKFNTTSVSPKGIIYDANGINGDQYYLTRLTSVNSDIWTPARFELILPPPPNENEITEDYKGLEMIYFGPSVSNVDFTAIRQKDTNLGEYYIEDNSSNLKSVYNWPKEYFETIKTGISNTPMGEIYFHPFRGIDLRGYKDLIFNFHGLINIVGIAGMNSLSVPNIVNSFGENCFSGFFSNCKKLQIFHSTEKIEDEIINEKPNVYQYNKWDFSNWFSPTWGQYFSNISRMFQGCAALNDLTYLEGILNPMNSNGFKVENASSMFESCVGLKQANINWKNIFSTVNNIEAMFQNCFNLEIANITIAGIDVKKENGLKSLKNLFSGCTKLKEQAVVLLTDASPAKSAFKYIEDVSEMCYMCESLESVDYSLTFDDLEIESNEINVFNFDNLKVATSWFQGCKALKEVKFPSIVNFTKLEDCSTAFENCENLQTIFVNSQIKLYDSKQSIEDLAMTQFLANCKSLTSIGGLVNIDGTRITAIDGMFTNNLNLTGELDLSNWIFDITKATYNENGDLLTEEKANKYVNTRSLFSGCSGLTSIKLPKIYTNNLASMFFGCNNLISLDVSPIIPEKQMLTDGTRIGPDNFSYIFSGCSKLTSDSFTGYQNWNVKYGSIFSSMFTDCLKLTELDLSNWKITHSENDVAIDLMFKGCISLKNIKGLNGLFGTFDDVLNRVEGKYNTKYFTADGVFGLFNGCYNLLLGQNENNIASWARMAVKISTMAEMFQGCGELIDLKLVFARGKINSTTEAIFIPSSEVLYWGSNKHSGLNTESNINCKFEALSIFASMCTGCTKLKHFDYFDSANNNIDYIKEVQDQYIYPSDLSGIVAGCTSLTNFAFIMNGLGMHNIISDMSLAFNGCSKLTAITFPSRTEKNLGIKKNLTLIGGLTETDWINQLAGEVPTWLYDFTSNQIPPIAEQNEGKLTLPAAAENWEIVSPGSNFEANMIALGWDVVIPENTGV